MIIWGTNITEGGRNTGERPDAVGGPKDEKRKEEIPPLAGGIKHAQEEGNINPVRPRIKS